MYSFACFVLELFKKSSPLRGLPRNVVNVVEPKLRHIRARVTEKQYKQYVLRAAVAEAQSAGDEGRRDLVFETSKLADSLFQNS